MTEKLSKEETIGRGKDALNLLNDLAFGAAIEQAKEAIVERWKLAKSEKVREAQHAQLMALNLVVIELMTFANDGKHVQHNLDLAEKRARGPGSSQRQGA
ncbi:hypothetical protein LCGC14_1793860 [marine sediment metagenome]|uniref:Uncharacterized protein n=1 Tax=marine sediment metagenome TaxID=412755 RepID=A0A0F9GRR7_9ZZZZ